MLYLTPLYGWPLRYPFPFAVAEHALDIWNAQRAVEEFPPPSDPRWHTFGGPLESGKQEGRAEIAGPTVRALHGALASESVVAWLRALSGVPDLVADPERVGGGIHQSSAGGRLGVHIDFNLHPKRPDLIRAVNVILFVGGWNALDWPRDEPGGRFEIWSDRGRVLSLAPRVGTLLAFEASDRSWHGHPEPIVSERIRRCSIPAYYYRPIREDETVVARSTQFWNDVYGRD